MPGLKDIPGEHKLVRYFAGHATAGAAKEHAVARAPFRCTVTGIAFIPSANIVGAAGNYFTVNVRNRGAAGAGAAIPATLAYLNGTNSNAQIAQALTLSGTAADLVFAEGDVITAEKAITGAGLACPDGLIVITVKAS